MDVIDDIGVPDCGKDPRISSRSASLYYYIFYLCAPLGSEITFTSDLRLPLLVHLLDFVKASNLLDRKLAPGQISFDTDASCHLVGSFLGPGQVDPGSRQLRAAWTVDHRPRDSRVKPYKWHGLTNRLGHAYWSRSNLCRRDHPLSYGGWSQDLASHFQVDEFQNQL
ncbi:hypothetical protein Ancab_031227 [Ancistrocladus abbreviatus]